VLTEHSKRSGIEHGLHKVAEVMLGCAVGLLVTWLIPLLWPVPDPRVKPDSQPVKA
jgi:hypothetical protein